MLYNIWWIAPDHRTYHRYNTSPYTLYEAEQEMEERVFIRQRKRGWDAVILPINEYPCFSQEKRG